MAASNSAVVIAWTFTTLRENTGRKVVSRSRRHRPLRTAGDPCTGSAYVAAWSARQQLRAPASGRAAGHVPEAAGWMAMDRALAPRRGCGGTSRSCGEPRRGGRIDNRPMASGAHPRSRAGIAGFRPSTGESRRRCYGAMQGASGERVAVDRCVAGELLRASLLAIASSDALGCGRPCGLWTWCVERATPCLLARRRGGVLNERLCVHAGGEHLSREGFGDPTVETTASCRWTTAPGWRNGSGLQQGDESTRSVVVT
jgi:hypothetical protein